MRDIIPIFIPHLGCPHDCIFCNQRNIAAATAPAASDVAAIIESAIKKTSAAKPQVAFYGGSFTAIPAEAQQKYLGVVNRFIEDGRVSSIRISTRPDYIDEDTLIRLKSLNVSTIEIGAQSMADEVLFAAGRGHGADDTRVASKIIKEHDFELILQMMIGLPLDTRELTAETAREIAELKPDGVRIYPVAVIRDTRLEILWREGGYTPLSVDAAAEICAVALDIFNKKNIPVIRIGLNPTDELSGGTVLAGAYHPAFGELCRSKLYLKEARKALAGMGKTAGRRVVLYVNPKRISVMCGQHGENRSRIKEEFSVSKLDVRGREIPEPRVEAEFCD